MTRRRAAMVVAVLLATPRAQAEDVTRGSETGFIEVPSADVLPERLAAFHTELRFDRGDGGPSSFGPSPVGVVFGLPLGFEGGFAAREGGLPGDPRPSPLTYSAALKLQLVAPERSRLGVALDVVGDRLNFGGDVASRLVATTPDLGGFRFGAIAGARTHGPRPYALEPVLGAAASLAVRDRTTAILEATRYGSDLSLSAGLRWSVGSRTTSTASLTWLPGENGVRLAIGVAFSPARPRYATPAKPSAPAPQAAAAAPKKPAFSDPRPHFRLRLRSPALALGAPRHMQYGPYSPPAAAAAAPKPAAGAVSAVPSMENILEAQLQERESSAAARRRRLETTGEALAARDSAAAASARKLAAREQELGEREARLDERERTLRARGGAVTSAERQLESTEAQFAASERRLAAQALSLGAAIDAAAGREKDLSTRADAERGEADRLAAQAAQAPERQKQLDVRGAALAARLRQLAAEEALLVARGERIDALERQLSMREEQLDQRARRLDARAERLDLVDRRVGGETRPPASGKPPATGARDAAKDKPAFTMIVKSPASILKDSAAPGATKPDAGPVHVGTAVEKAVAAATVLTFPTPSAQLSELDREALTNIAKLGEKEGLEILVWARAKDPGTMPEATRRAEEIKQLLRKSASVADGQVVTRITTRPGAAGVDVVVSALRVQQPAKAAPAPSAPAAVELGAGETAKRQIREAVQAHASEIEACIGNARRVDSAEVVLKLTVDGQGVVSRAQVQEGPLATEQLRSCIGSVAKGWKFPRTGAEYAVDVPITVVAPGRTP